VEERGNIVEIVHDNDSNTTSVCVGEFDIIKTAWKENWNSRD